MYVRKIHHPGAWEPYLSPRLVGEGCFFTHHLGEVFFLPKNFHASSWISNGAPLTEQLQALVLSEYLLRIPHLR